MARLDLDAAVVVVVVSRWHQGIVRQGMLGQVTHDGTHIDTDNVGRGVVPCRHGTQESCAAPQIQDAQ